MTRVLFVEDDPGLGPTLTQLLARAGLVVDHAATLADARRALGACAPDVALLDPGLPDGNALSLCDELLRLGIPILVLTGNRERGAEIDAFRVGVTDYLHKPVDLPLLLARLRAAARRRTPPPGRPGSAESPFVVDADRQEVRFGSDVVRFRGALPFKIWSYLAERRDVWVHAEQLRAFVLRQQTTKGSSTVRWHVAEVRHALGGRSRCVHSDRVLGYMFSLASCGRRHCGVSESGSVGTAQ